jgi:hypothetical protein
MWTEKEKEKEKGKEKETKKEEDASLHDKKKKIIEENK